MNEITIHNLIEKNFSDLGVGSAAIKRVGAFFDLLKAENEIQNLTRLDSEELFLNGHLFDCLELLRCKFLGDSNFDIGSGGGVPSVLSAALSKEYSWVANDSEKHKADFLERAVLSLNLENCKVAYGRAENLIDHFDSSTVVARAVGKVEKIFGWIEKCSTWNTLVLLKGPAWSDEWKEFKQSRHRNKLEMVGEHHYETPDKKTRVIVKLVRSEKLKRDK